MWSGCYLRSAPGIEDLTSNKHSDDEYSVVQILRKSRDYTLLSGGLPNMWEELEKGP